MAVTFYFLVYGFTGSISGVAHKKLSVNKPLTLSLVIPAYNEESYLKACLDSVANQTVQPLEVIIVDNNSTDKTQQIAEQYPFITVVHETMQGVVYARNKGFNAAKGDIIGRIDADTILDPNWVEITLKIFSAQQVDAITGSTHFYDMPGAPYNYKVEHVFKSFLYKYDNSFPFLFGTNMAIRRSAWRLVSKSVCTGKNIFEDCDLAIHLHQMGLTITYDTTLRAGMSSRRYNDKPRDFFRYINLYKVVYKQHGLQSFGSNVAVLGYTLGYITLWPLYKSYDHSTKKRSLKHFAKGGSKPRPQPMG
ncbi:MAG: hypothetical protein NVS1B7_6430 [Candidatus Saccharimonadales bacterium]